MRTKANEALDGGQEAVLKAKVIRGVLWEEVKEGYLSCTTATDTFGMLLLVVVGGSGVRNACGSCSQACSPQRRKRKDELISMAAWGW